MVLGNKRSKEKFGRFIKKICIVRDNFVTYGMSFFGMLGFLYGLFALVFILGDKTPSMISWSANAFGLWIGGSMILIFVIWCLTIVYKNKKNWCGGNRKSKIWELGH